MKQRKSPRLSADEMEVMEMLWRHGPVTLSAAQSAWPRPIGYTTLQTRLNRLVEKNVVSRTPERPAQYAAAVEPEAVSAGHLALLVDRVNGGSVVPLVAHLVRDWKLSRAEIAELKALIAEAERQSNPQAKKGAEP